MEVERELGPQGWSTSSLRVKMIILVVVRMVKMMLIMMMRAMTRLTLDQLLHTSIAEARSLKGSIARI